MTTFIRGGDARPSHKHFYIATVGGFPRYLQVREPVESLSSGNPRLHGADHADGLGRDVEVVVNQTDRDICVSRSYSTVANGSSDDLWVPAGRALILVNRGGPHDFATWKVVSVEGARQFAKQYAKQVSNLLSADDEQITISKE